MLYKDPVMLLARVPILYEHYIHIILTSISFYTYTYINI